jgi:all-trans-retinol dehydrogenase (NAD+)
MRSIIGKRLLITGAGHGLGREMARQFAARGAHVMVTDRDAAGVAETIGQLQADPDLVRRGGTLAGYAMDITDVAALAEVRQRLLAEQGPLDLLINNAGIVHAGPFLAVALGQHRQTLDVNLQGLLNVTHVFLPELIARPWAHLVNIASASAFVPLPYGASYAASKWGVLGFTESIREELRMLGHAHVSVTAVCPSYIDTGMFAGVRPPRLTRLLTPEKTAALVLKAVEHDRPLVLAPALVKLAPLLAAVLPRAWSRILAHALGVTTSMRECRPGDPDE